MESDWLMVDKIQRLLCTEYRDFNDLVLLESPFAETTRDGNGIIQLQIGLTRSKLVLALQYPCCRQSEQRQDMDGSELEGFELESLFPIDVVRLTVFRRRTRNTIKAHFANGVIRYFELAAPSRREMFWNLWLEKLKALTPEPVSSAQSETSVGSSNSSELTPTYGTISSSITWPLRDVFLGKTFGSGESKKKQQPSGELHIPREIETEMTPLNRKKDRSKVFQVNRFGAGVDERCCTSLYLPVQVYNKPNFEFALHSYEYYKDRWKCLAWKEREEIDDWDPPAPKVRPLHARRYGLATLPHHMFGLGLWPMSHVEASLTQLRKTTSSFSLPNGKPYNLGISKRLLVSGTSSENLQRYQKQQMPWLLFWTPGLWYKPRSVTESYKALRSHLESIKHCIEGPVKKKGWFTKFDKKKSKKQDIALEFEENLKQEVRGQLMVDIPLTSWDFDSTMLAQQITLIYKDLFLRIPVTELFILVRERSSKNAPNFRAMVAFSNRMVNIITTEIVRIKSVKMRARLIARWINVADKVYRLQNMEGVRSVLLGIQSPAVYRLAETWTSLRRYHNSKYRRLLRLLRLNMEPRSVSYSKLMKLVTETVPYLPSLDYIVAVILGWTPPVPSLSLDRQEESVDMLWQTWRSGSRNYKLTDTPLAKEFLTKTRYLEEMENFSLASKLEGRMNNFTE